METYTVTVDVNGTVRYYKPNTEILHRIDGPAIEYSDGSKYYYVDDNLHRIDGPAIEYANGTKVYYVDGVYFSEYVFNAQFMNSLNGKIVEIDGKQYRLTAA